MDLRHASLLTVLLLGCHPGSGSRPPTHKELVNLHLDGHYSHVIAWCPVVLEDSGAAPALSDWCMFAYPAAMRLALDTKGAVGFIRAVCQDITGEPKGDLDFREFYVGQAARWVALPLRVQGRDQQIERALSATVAEFSHVCAVEANKVRSGIDTRIKDRRDLR